MKTLALLAAIALFPPAPPANVGFAPLFELPLPALLSTGDTTITRAPVAIADTDGTNILSVAQVDTLIFTSPNPTRGPYTLAVSGDLATWQEIRQGTGNDPLMIYDFSYLTQPQNFYKFKVDSVQ